jgi:hypothetical protein
VTQAQPEPTAGFSAPEDAEDVEDDDGDEDYEDADENDDDDDEDEDEDDDSPGTEGEGFPAPFTQHDPVVDTWSSPDSLVLGLRVYTHKDAVAVIGGQLYGEKVPLKQG